MNEEEAKTKQYSVSNSYIPSQQQEQIHNIIHNADIGGNQIPELTSKHQSRDCLLGHTDLAPTLLFLHSSCANVFVNYITDNRCKKTL